MSFYTTAAWAFRVPKIESSKDLVLIEDFTKLRDFAISVFKSNEEDSKPVVLQLIEGFKERIPNDLAIKGEFQLFEKLFNTLFTIDYRGFAIQFKSSKKYDGCLIILTEDINRIHNYKFYNELNSLAAEYDSIDDNCAAVEISEDGHYEEHGNAYDVLSIDIKISIDEG